MAGGNLFSAEEDATILRLRDEWDGRNGWAREAARILGRSRNSITNRMKMLLDRRACASAPNVAQLTRSVRHDAALRVHVLAPLETDLEPELARPRVEPLGKRDVPLAVLRVDFLESRTP